MLNILAYPYCFLAYPTNSTYLWSKPVFEIRFAGRAPLILVCATATWATFWKSLCHRTTAPLFQQKNCTIALAALRHILETKIRAFQNVHHCAIFFKKLSRITFTFLLKLPVSCLLSPVSRLLSYFFCLTSLVSLLLSSLLSHVSCLTINCLMSPVSPKKLKLGCFLKNVYNNFFLFLLQNYFFSYPLVKRWFST